MSLMDYLTVTKFDLDDPDIDLTGANLGDLLDSYAEYRVELDWSLRYKAKEEAARAIKNDIEDGTYLIVESDDLL